MSIRTLCHFGCTFNENYFINQNASYYPNVNLKRWQIAEIICMMGYCCSMPLR